MTRSEIESALHLWLSTATGITVIFEDQAEVRPPTPYVTAKITSIRTFGLDDERSISDSLGVPNLATRSYCGDREVTVSVQSFGSGAMDYTTTAARSLMTEEIRSQLAVSGLTMRGVAPSVSDATGLLETDYQERARFDVTLAYADEYTGSVGLIEAIEISGEYQNPPDDPRQVGYTIRK